ARSVAIKQIPHLKEHVGYEAMANDYEALVVKLDALLLELQSLAQGHAPFVASELERLQADFSQLQASREASLQRVAELEQQREDALIEAESQLCQRDGLTPIRDDLQAQIRSLEAKLADIEGEIELTETREAFFQDQSEALAAEIAGVKAHQAEVEEASLERSTGSQRE
ncbi:hypothetical protein ACDT16_13760, partial [Staphylococcus aureus]